MLIQDIFNQVIHQGHYRRESRYTRAMCNALEDVYHYHHIGVRELVLGKQEIANYLKNYTALTIALSDNDLPNQFSDRLVIYKDWKNRPILKY